MDEKENNKILLINPGYYKEHYRYKQRTHKLVHREPPPVSLLYVGTYLHENGFDVEIIDTKIEDNYVELISKKIKENDFLFVGLNVIIGGILRNAKEITKLIREINPDLPIVWGGIIASILPGECLMKYKPDYIVRFEGEETCLELAKAIKNKSSTEHIRGISYIKDNKIVNNPVRMPRLNLDDYPIPKWELFGSYFNKKQVPYYFLIMSSKGCPFNCTFCYKHSIDEKIRSKIPPWRGRSAQHVIKEIDYIHKKTGTRVFTFGDDNFLINKERAKEIFDYLRKKKFYIEECTGHINLMDDEMAGYMEGIVQTFSFSTESASPRLQKYIDKKINIETVPDKVEKLYEKGIICTTSLIVGFPTETKEDLRKNVELLLKLKKINPFMKGNIYLCFPLPKTKMCELLKKDYKLPLDLSDLEEANENIALLTDVDRKFRPWISEERYRFLIKYGIFFNEVFKANNSKYDEKILDFMQDDEIKEMFKGIENINRPKTDYKPYVLDKVLNGEEVDLVNGLKDK
jgi:radical SAM superfamily enzyme YgiQ (UPF0313 family)